MDKETQARIQEIAAQGPIPDEALARRMLAVLNAGARCRAAQDAETGTGDEASATAASEVADSRDWASLATATKTRRTGLGLGRHELPGISPSTVQAIEQRRRTNITARTLARLDAALQWRPGSCQAVLARGKPRALTTAPPPSDHVAEESTETAAPFRLGDDPDRMLTYEEFAAHLQVPKRTVAHWISSGTGPRVVAFGKHRRIRASDAIAWLDTNYVDE